MEEENKEGVSQTEIQDLLFNKEIGWQDIIYDLINTEQLDPWNIDITILVDGFLLKIEEYGESDFFISSKVLLAVSLLLRIKSELILSKYLKTIDAILFGEEEKEVSREFEGIELDEDIPALIPKSPIPRFSRVTLKDLIDSLSRAINTENRRIKKVIINRNALRESGISLPKKVNSLKNSLTFLHKELMNYFKSDKRISRISYTELVGENKKEKFMYLYPLLELEKNGDFWLHQNLPFEEIHVWMKEFFIKENGHPYQDLMDGEWNEEHVEKSNNFNG